MTQQYNKFYASYSQYGTTTTFNSVGRTLEVFFAELQRDAWVAADRPKDGERHREAVTLRQAGAILRHCDAYTIHEPDGSTWSVCRADLPESSAGLGQTLLNLASRTISVSEQQAASATDGLENRI